MQGWDSVEIKADVELGGTEQLFSLLVARDLQVSEGQPPQAAMTMPILVGTDGARRMGKSLGNYIGVAEDPVTQFAKVMSIPDEPMRQYFTLLTDMAPAEVDALLSPGKNPRDAKDVLGRAIVRCYSGAEAAAHASDQFRRRSKGEDPDEIPSFSIKLWDTVASPRFLPSLLVTDLKFDTSTSNARRMIEQGGVTVGKDRMPITNPNPVVVPSPEARTIRLVQGSETVELAWDDFLIRYGKRKIGRIDFIE